MHTHRRAWLSCAVIGIVVAVISVNYFYSPRSQGFNGEKQSEAKALIAVANPSTIATLPDGAKLILPVGAKIVGAEQFTFHTPNGKMTTELPFVRPTE